MFTMRLFLLSLLLTSFGFTESAQHDLSFFDKTGFSIELEEGPLEKATCLYLEGSLNDFVDNGEKRFYVQEEGCKFSISSSENKSISVKFMNSKCEGFSLFFAAPEGEVLTPRIYKNIKELPERGKRSAVFSIREYGLCCTESTGEFEVLELTYGTDDKVEAFAANFIQRRNSGPPLFGSVRYHSSIELEPRFGLYNGISILHFEEFNQSGSSEGSSTLTSDGHNFSLEPLAFGGNGVAIKILDMDGESWFFEFAAAEGDDFEEGDFDCEIRYPFHNYFIAGMSISTPHESFSFLSSKFKVLKIDRNENGEIVSLAINFAACTREGRLLAGAIRYNADNMIIRAYPYNELRVDEYCDLSHGIDLSSGVLFFE